MIIRMLNKINLKMFGWYYKFIRIYDLTLKEEANENMILIKPEKME